MAWTDQMVEDLRKMWKEGLTTGEIGKRLNVSKNSIVGKVHRLGLSGRPSPIKKKEVSTAESPAKNTPAAQPSAASKETKTPKAEKEISHKNTEKPSPANTKSEEKHVFTQALAPNHCIKHRDNLSLTDLDNHTCRWPLGDPKDDNFHFCGKKIRIGQTYCEEHSAMAYVKPAKK